MSFPLSDQRALDEGAKKGQTEKEKEHNEQKCHPLEQEKA
ncbi:hypothetical protein HM1_2667 [Heliomicrobium modesticaldum Ice1]|uniref:Uncharacterized protein n=1 Tax=Heliobacterium modesticaldum (strain ATCC 51547 / Ice1) TaxID=498761 RepID=B0TBI3_HELMI|nr:hypothetical protein HM1_2667 [Heliomicrobium modesticaldum Ice1]